MFLIPEQFEQDEITSADIIINEALPEADIDTIGRDAARKIAWLVTGTVACACGVLADKEFNDTLGKIQSDLEELRAPQARKHFITILNHTLRHWEAEPVVPSDTFDMRLARCLKVG